MGWLEALLVAVAGLRGGFVSTLASNGSTLTLPALEFLGLPEHVANGTNRPSVVAPGLVGASFYRGGLLDLRKGAWIAALVVLGPGFFMRAARRWARIWGCRFLVIVAATIQVLLVDTGEFLALFARQLAGRA